MRLALNARVRLGCAFAGSEIAMQVVGYELGTGAGRVLGEVATYVGFGLLAAIGGLMIRSSFRHASEEEFDATRGTGLLITSLSISLDSLGVGIALPGGRDSVVAVADHGVDHDDRFHIHRIGVWRAPRRTLRARRGALRRRAADSSRRAVRDRTTSHRSDDGNRRLSVSRARSHLRAGTQEQGFFSAWAPPFVFLSASDCVALVAGLGTARIHGGLSFAIFRYTGQLSSCAPGR